MTNDKNDSKTGWVDKHGRRELRVGKKLRGLPVRLPTTGNQEKDTALNNPSILDT